MTRTQIGKDARRPNGFTLIELVIVIAVIAILAGLLVPTILGQAERARITKAKSDANEIAKAAARMRTDTASRTLACYTLANLQATDVPADCGTITSHPNCRLPSTLPGARCWNGPYFPANALPKDPWDTLYDVKYNDVTKAITVKSFGEDKIEDAAAGGDDQVVIQ